MGEAREGETEEEIKKIPPYHALKYVSKHD
jgi:hypothetical protein